MSDSLSYRRFMEYRRSQGIEPTQELKDFEHDLWLKEQAQKRPLRLTQRCALALRRLFRGIS